MFSKLIYNLIFLNLYLFSTKNKTPYIYLSLKPSLISIICVDFNIVLGHLFKILLYFFKFLKFNNKINL